MKDYLEMLKNGRIYLKQIPEEERTEEICLEAVTEDGLDLEYVPEEMRTEEVCLEAVTENGQA